MSKALLKSTSVVAAMTLLSRILGFARDMVIAYTFGATAAADAFFIAFKIPNFMRALFAEGSFSQAFVPVLAGYRQERSHEETQAFIGRATGVLSAVLFLLTVLGMLGAPLLVKLFAPGLDVWRFSMASAMLRITFPYLMLISLTALACAVLNSYGKFAMAAFNPTLLNVCMIVAAIALAPRMQIPVMGLAWGVFAGGVVQLLLALPLLQRLKLLSRPRLNWHDEGVRQVLRLMIPGLFGASIGQIGLLLNTVFASFLQVGSVTWLYFSDRLTYFPLGVFGVALATVVLPQLSRQHVTQSRREFAATLDWGVRCNLLIGMPASITMGLFAAPLVITVFQRGEFSFHDVTMTCRSVVAYSVGLLAFMLVKVLSSAFYAQKDVRSPVRIGLIVLGINLVLNALFLFSPLAHAGLALASSLAAWFNVILLGIILYRRGIYHVQAGWGMFVLRLLAANAVLGIFLAWQSGEMITWMQWSTSQRFLHVFLIGGAAIAIYAACLVLSGMRLQDFKTRTVASSS